MARVAVIGPARPLVQPVLQRLLDRPATNDAIATDSVDGAEVVVHVAGADPELWFRDADAAADATVNRTRQVLDEAAGAQVRSLVHISSAAVYGAWPDNPVPLSEDAPLRPNRGFAYARAHAESERLVAEWVDEHDDVAVAVLRPAIVMRGDGPSLLARAVGALRSPRAVEAGRPLQFVHADDVAGAVALAVDHRLSGVYNVAPDGWVPDETARALAGGLARVPLPGWFARPLARLSWRVTRRGMPAEAEPWTMHPWVVANDRLRAVGWEPAYTNEEAFVAASPPSRLAALLGRRRQEVTLAAATTGITGVIASVYVIIRRRRRRVRS
jgi:nucleoside-diphosphate-sugar epimerase